jgi:uncharacterized protein YcaQ
VPLELSRAVARRFLVLRHLLAPPRALPAEPESVLAVVERLGFLQFDPLEVPGARNHDLVLHARIAGYRRAWTEEWLYGPDRRLIELYNKGLNLVPIAELPHYRVTWDRNAPIYRDGILREQAAVADAILEGIRERGPLSTAAFAEHDHSVDWWWAPTRAARAVAEALFVSGRLGIYRREGNRRHYELLERLVPEELLARRESDEEGMLHRLLSRYQAAGLTTPAAQAEVMLGTGKVAERARRTAELVDRGLVVPVEVEALKGTRYIVAAEQPLLEAAAQWNDAAHRDVAFIAPLDPIAWDRRLLRDLWDFDYLWEVYVPEARRRWGYYVLPVLFGDRLVGRIEPRLDRATRTLRIAGLWWEEGFAPRRADGFVPAMRRALSDFRRFVEADRVEWAHATGGAARLFGTTTGTR